MSKLHSLHRISRPVTGCSRPAPRRGFQRPLALLLPLSASLVLSACAGSGLELAALSQADPASDSAASSTSSAAAIETASLKPVDASAAKSNADEVEVAQSPEISKARGLRANGDLAGAMAVLTNAAKESPKSKALLRERGLLALEMGQISQAKTLLKKADDPKAPDWRIKSALGSALAASGDQQAAQREFAAALKLAPDQPSVLNNLALSYALDGRHKQAETLLRQASQNKNTSAKAKQNLALLLGLNGEIDEARKVSEAALPQNESKANISYLERLRSDGQVSRAQPRAADKSTTASTALNVTVPPN